jgi:hypothetical protein
MADENIKAFINKLEVAKNDKSVNILSPKKAEQPVLN